MGRDVFPEMLAETCVGVYRVRYSYYLGLVSGMRLVQPLVLYAGLKPFC